jgi:hypothetical protein
MTWPDQRWSETDVLDPVAAAAEMDAWLHDPRPYKHQQHQQGWKSAADDFHAATPSIGPQLAAALGVDLTTALQVTAGLPGTDPTPARPAAQAALAALRARWTDPAVLEAAWLDIADACQDPHTPYETVAARRDLFWQLVRAADRNTRELGRLLAGVLDDEALRVCMARVHLGDIPSPDRGAWPQPDDPAGLAEPDLIDLCRPLLVTPATPAHHVVWVAFDRARLYSTTLTVGAVTFYDGAWLCDALENNGPGRSQLPAELTNLDSPLRLLDLPKGDRIVLARVELGTGVFTDAPRVAAEQAQAVVTIASARTGGRHWRPLKGYLHATDGRITARSSFTTPFQRADVAPDLRTADELGTLATTLGPRLPVTDPALTETIDALGWWQDAADQPPLAAVVLDVRVLELTAARVTNDPWYRYLDSYLAANWIHTCIINTLLSAVSAAVRDFSGVIPSSEHTQLAALEATIFAAVPRGRRVFHADHTVAALPALATIWPVHDHVGRQIHTLAAHLASPADLERWCQALHARWTRARERLQRTRNALAHGGPLTPAAAGTVHRLAHQLAGGALALTLEGLLDGRGASKGHIDARDRMTAWRDGVSGSASVHDAVFPPMIRRPPRRTAIVIGCLQISPSATKQETGRCPC